MGNCPCEETLDEPLLNEKLVDFFYSELFAKYNVNGSLLEQNGEIFSRISLDPEETQAMRTFLLHKNLLSRCFPLDTSRPDPLPRISFVENSVRKKQKVQMEMEAILNQIEEEKLALLDLSDKSLQNRDSFRFLFHFQVDKPAYRYIMRYNISDPVAQIVYHVTNPETALRLWHQLRNLREVLYDSFSKKSSPEDDSRENSFSQKYLA